MLKAVFDELDLERLNDRRNKYKALFKEVRKKLREDYVFGVEWLVVYLTDEAFIEFQEFLEE